MGLMKGLMSLPVPSPGTAVTAELFAALVTVSVPVVAQRGVPGGLASERRCWVKTLLSGVARCSGPGWTPSLPTQGSYANRPRCPLPTCRWPLMPPLAPKQTLSAHSMDGENLGSRGPPRSQRGSGEGHAKGRKTGFGD